MVAQHLEAPEECLVLFRVATPRLKIAESGVVERATIICPEGNELQKVEIVFTPMDRTDLHGSRVCVVTCNHDASRVGELHVESSVPVTLLGPRGGGMIRHGIPPVSKEGTTYRFVVLAGSYSLAEANHHLLAKDATLPLEVIAGLTTVAKFEPDVSERGRIAWSVRDRARRPTDLYLLNLRGPQKSATYLGSTVGPSGDIPCEPGTYEITLVEPTGTDIVGTRTVEVQRGGQSTIELDMP
jgi:hypothetical protein